MPEDSDGLPQNVKLGHDCVNYTQQNIDGCVISVYNMWCEEVH